MNVRDLSLSERVARFVADTVYEDLPAAVVAKAKRHMLDTLGAALAGAHTAQSRQARGVMNAPGDAVVWGTTMSASARDAAFNNGVAAHALELDDSGGCDHSGAVVLPAAIAALSCLQRPVSGKEFVTAVVLGYDVARRVLEACGGYAAHNGRGWHSTMTCGVFGAAAASARLQGLDASGISAALGHAASFSGGLWAFIHDGSQTKRLHSGRAAEGGLSAALLAASGVTGPTQIFEDGWGGFLRAFAQDTQQPEALTAELGATWKIMRCSIKPHACCRSTHAAVDATLALAADGKSVTHVHVRLSAFVNGMCGDRRPVNLASAQMSMPYAIAASLVFGDANIESFLETRRNDPRVHAMMERITLEPDESMADLDEPEVTVTYADGSARSCRIEIPLGDPRNPLDDARLFAKYRSLAQVSIGEVEAKGLTDFVLGIDDVCDVRAISTMLQTQEARRMDSSVLEIA
jgi:2-methylcitrate dehydratase PrpD